MSTLQITEAELLAQFRDFMARRGQGPHTFVPLQNSPGHLGVIDAGFVRPPAKEYPRMMHHASGMTKIVQDRDEQEALGPQWFTEPQKKKSDWRAKANEVFTKSGFQVHTAHVHFLQESGVPNIETLQNAAEFLDKLNDAEQEQFFREAEDVQVPEAKVEKASKKGK